MLDQEVLTCEIVRMRHKQVRAKYHYGITDCIDCERLEEYVYALALDQLSACGTFPICVTVRGTGCPDSELETSCVSLEVDNTYEIPLTPIIAAILP